MQKTVGHLWTSFFVGNSREGPAPDDAKSIRRSPFTVEEIEAFAVAVDHFA
jgi:hypothetical protein